MTAKTNAARSLGWKSILFVILVFGLLQSAAATTWYFNPNQGNDNYDGNSMESAWASITKFNTAPFQEGDSVVVDTVGGPLDLGGQTLHIRTRGLTVRAPQGQWIDLKIAKELDNSQFEKMDGCTSVYWILDAQPSVVLWENACWLNKIVATTFDGASHVPIYAGSSHTNTDFGSVAEALDAIPGSFWTDGTNLFVHPFGSTDPRSDGKVYTRSYVFPNGTAIEISAANIVLKDIRGGGTTLARADNNDAIGNYVIGTGGSFGGSSRIEHCHLNYGGKHIIGLVADATNSITEVVDVFAEQGSPYSGIGGQTPFVSYMQLATSTNNIHRYVNCVCTQNSGLIGSPAGTNTITSVFISHNSSSGIQFAELQFIGCNFTNQNMGPGVSHNLLLTNTTIGEVNTSCSNNVYFESTLSMFTATQPGITNTVMNSRIEPNYIQLHLNGGSMQGVVIIRHSVLDLAKILKSIIPTEAIFMRVSKLDFTFENNAFLVPKGLQYTVIQNATNGEDTLTFRNNIYRLGSNGYVVHNVSNYGAYGDIKLSDWKMMGFDEGSLTVDALKINIMKAGADLSLSWPETGPVRLQSRHSLAGPWIDFTGELSTMFNNQFVRLRIGF